MAQHLEIFASEYMTGKPRGYLIALAIACKNVFEKGRLSDKIKDTVGLKGAGILRINTESRARRYKIFLSQRTDEVVSDPILVEKIKALRVKDFRGFGSFGEDDKGSLIEFNPGKNIFYAPNGGGKTSLCEALEYVFTGGIKEAQRRRTKINDYIGRGSQKAIARVKTLDDREFKGSAAISSCFIDKNRLQEFSLLGSKDTNSNERDVLASLFGLEEIEDLLTRFVQPKSFSLQTYKRNDASVRQSQLYQEYSTVFDAKLLALSKIESARKKILDLLGLERYDRDEVAVRLHFRERLLSFKREKLAALQFSELPDEINLNEIRALLRKTRRDLIAYAEVKQEMVDRVADVAFEELFAAIGKLDNTERSDHCPACMTPLDKVNVNPYSRAKGELEKLVRVAELRQILAKKKNILNFSYQKISSFYDTFEINNGRGIVLSKSLDVLKAQFKDLLTISEDTAEQKSYAIGSLLTFAAENNAALQEYIISCNKFRAEKIGKKEMYVARTSQIEKLVNQLEEVRFMFRDIRGARDQIRLLSPTLAAYRGSARDVVSQVGEENALNSLLDEIQAEYGNLCDDLKNYKIKVEDSQIAGIEKKATQYYQLINAGEDESVQITALLFVRSDAGYRISISCQDGTSQDAFSCLSEGHLRSLGLALLLALAQKRRYPFIIFDDVVNAIDSDHRANIIELMFKDDYLNTTQQIITTHDRLFWERYCNAVKGRYNEDQFSCSVLSCTNKGIVLMDYDAGFRQKVESALLSYDIRQALIYSRIWFETMVVRYCVDKQLEITANFSRRELKQNNYLEISLESTYGHIYNIVKWDPSNIDIIKSDLINWKGQNQEHHAFDEMSFNFSHSKTSNEIKKIYDAIIRFEYQLFPDEFLLNLGKAKNHADTTLQNILKQLNDPLFVQNAKADVVSKYRERKLEMEKRCRDLDLDLAYVQLCADQLA